MATHPKGGIAVVIGMGKPRRSGLPPVRGDELDPFDDPRQAAQRHAQRQREAADIEAAFTGRPQPHGTYDEQTDNRATPEQAGYMELASAHKGGDCELVDVPGGVSPLRGCCNLFTAPDAHTGPDGVTVAGGASLFNCGQCVHFQRGAAPAALTRGTAGTDLAMSA